MLGRLGAAVKGVGGLAKNVAGAALGEARTALTGKLATSSCESAVVNSTGQVEKAQFLLDRWPIHFFCNTCSRAK